MKTRTFDTKIKIPVTVTAVYYDAESETRDSPGYPAHIVIDSVKIFPNGRNILNDLSPEIGAALVLKASMEMQD